MKMTDIRDKGVTNNPTMPLTIRIHSWSFCGIMSATILLLNPKLTTFILLQNENIFSLHCIFYVF